VHDLRALALIYDIRGFTAASKRLKTADLGAFATGAHRVVLDQFASHPPTFVKNLGDGHLLLWECPTGLDEDLVQGVVHGAGKARTAFAAFARAQREAGLEIPGHVGIGVAFGEVSRSDDYYGRALNLASRLQNEARPEGLALDGDVFGAVSRREGQLRERFKRARVRLKGLGSTVVYVDRPFSWARALAPVAKALGIVALPLGYLMLCDAGLGLPGGDAVRRMFDARDMSLFRQVALESQVRAEAARLRGRIVAAMLANRVPGGWFYNAFPVSGDVSPEQAAIQAGERRADEGAPDIWSTAQAVYALVREPSTDRARFVKDLAPVLDVVYGPRELVEHEGRPVGWRPRRDERYTQAEPTLWALAATAAALARPGLLAGDERRVAQQRLARAQEAALTFRPTSSGGWNIFPAQRVPERYSPYTTTLALLALVESRAAGAGWRGDPAELQRLTEETVAFLGRTFTREDKSVGWRRTAEATEKISTGLTMQACATLLRAEAETGIPVPPHVLAAIPELLVERAAARAYDDYDMGEFIIEFTPPGGEKVSGKEGINFLSHPWAIDCAARWLARAQAKGADPGDRTRVRRAWGQLVIGLGPEAVDKALRQFLFIASETLIGLSSVPGPEAP
jgi:class 3 adenylate cyclase